MLKIITELGPLLAFFIGYKAGGILHATMYMLPVSVVMLLARYIIEKQVDKVNIFSTALLAASAGLTLLSGNTTFIKMKPTLLYTVFAFIFLFTSFKNKPAIQYVLGHVVQFKNDSDWKILNLRFMLFFIAMAIVNELIWRNFSEEIWVNCKVFGALPITFLFIAVQIPFIMKKGEMPR